MYSPVRFDVQYVLPTFQAIVREGDWLLRPCPACGQTARVGLDPNHPDDAMQFISRPDFICASCRATKREVDNAIYRLDEVSL